MKDIIFYELLNMDDIRLGLTDNRIEELLQDWLNENNIDTIVTIFDIGAEHITLNIDYSFDKVKDTVKIQKLTEMFLDKLNINYKEEVE